MKILFLTYEAGIAGSTYSISYLAKGLAEKGHQIYVGCPHDSVLHRILEGTSVIRVPMQIRNKIDNSNISQIAKLVKTEGIDIVNAQSSRDRYTSIFANYFYGLDISVIHTRRQRPESIGGWLQNWIYVKGTQRIVAVSNGVKQGLVALGIPEKHIEVIHNGIPVEKFHRKDPQKNIELRQKYSIKPSDFVIGCVSRHKQQEQLLQALHHIKDPVTVVLVGDGQRPAYQNIIKSYVVPHRVLFAGRIPAEQSLAHYHMFDIKVLPSTMEGLSQSLLEAMAFGIPVIATRAAGNIDLIQAGKNGLFFENNNVEQLSERINELRNDQALYKKLAINGYKTARIDFSIGKTIEKYERFFLRETQIHAAKRKGVLNSVITSIQKRLLN